MEVGLAPAPTSTGGGGLPLRRHVQSSRWPGKAGIDQVLALTDLDNTPSQRVAARLGMD